MSLQNIDLVTLPAYWSTDRSRSLFSKQTRLHAEHVHARTRNVAGPTLLVKMTGSRSGLRSTLSMRCRLEEIEGNEEVEVEGGEEDKEDEEAAQRERCLVAGTACFLEGGELGAGRDDDDDDECKGGDLGNDALSCCCWR